MKKNILMIGPHPDSWGGIAACSKSLEETESMKDSYTFTHLTTWKNGKWIINFIKSLFIIKQLARDADLVHINLSKNGSTYRNLLLFPFIKNKKYIVHMHYGNYGSFYENSPSFIKKSIITFLENASYIVFVSNYQKNETLNKINLKNKNIKVIYNGITLSQSKPITKNYIQVIYLGSLIKDRHFDEYIEIANTLSNENIKFVVAGNGQINKKHLKSIEYHGFVTNKEKEKLLINSDIIYSHFQESFGIGLLEAMNHHVCPLAFPSGSIPEIICDNKYGILFNNKKEFIDKLIFLKNNRELLAEYQQKAYDRSLNYSIEKYIDSFKSLYSEVIHRA